jgi:hypothetical protein
MVFPHFCGMNQIRQNQVILIFCLLIWAGKLSGQAVFTVGNFGATPDGKTNCSQSIQKAIDACHSVGGGFVVFPAGKFLTSTFYLKSNVVLRLDPGSEVLASRNGSDYTQTKGIYSTETDVPCLIMATGAKNIGIEGQGTLNGQAAHEWSDLKEVDNFIRQETELARKTGVEMKRAYALDPKVCLLYITNCENVRIENLTITASPNWAVHLANCRDVLIRGIRLYSSLEKGVNSDGLDIDGCRNVRISDCHIETGDDAICLKSTNKNGIYHACEQVTVTNCTLISTSTALKIGTESHGDFRNIVFSNSTISNTNRGIGIFVRDGANVDGVLFTNLVIECRRKHFNWWGDGDPIRFVLLKRKPDSRLGSIKNVVVSNVVARGQGTSLVAGFEGDSLNPPKALENIRFHQVQLTMEPETVPDKRATSNLKVSQVDGFVLENSRLTFEKGNPSPSWTSSLELKMLQNATLRHCETDAPALPGLSAITFENVAGAELFWVKPIRPEACYLHVKGKDSKDIRIDLPGEEDQRPCLKLAPEVSKKAVVLR